MKKIFKRITALMLLPIAFAVAAAVFFLADSSDVNFEDENLEAAVREELEQPAGPVRQEDLQEVDVLDLSNKGITSIEGIEKFITVRDLDLQGNRIEDIEPLEDLIYLESLNLRGNQLGDLSSIEGMERLDSLDVRDTGIKDLTPLSSMRVLSDLNVRGNSIKDLAPLENMSSLITLNARNNQIENISVLSELSELEDINLRNNHIEDFSPLFDLPHLTQRVFVSGNPGFDIEEFAPLYDQVENVDIEDPEAAVVFNKQGGSFENPQTIELSQLLNEEGTIRYTLDGSEPDENSREYTEPIEVEETTVVKAKFFDRYDNPGALTANSYVIGEESTFPIVSVSGNPDDFFGDTTGIYAQGPGYDENADNPHENANYMQTGEQWEREVTVEMYKPDQTQMIHQQAGIRLHGNASRHAPKKSFRLYGRADYSSENTFAYPLFENEEQSEYNRLLLRSSGNDWDETVFRDAFLQELIDGFNVETQAVQPAQLYLNGEYWGVYNLRERVDHHYFEYKYGILEENLELLENNSEASSGNNRHYENMKEYIRDHDISDPDVYANVNELMDIDSFIDYNIAEIYTRNTDWPHNNTRYWREKPNGKWKWTIFDLDFSYGLEGVPETSAHHTLDLATATDNREWHPNDWSTFLLRSLLENEEFRAEFTGKFSHYLNTHFNSDRVTTKLNEYEELYEPEMERNIERWEAPADMNEWHEHVNVMREFGQERPDFMYAHLVDKFDVSGYLHLAFNMDSGHDIQVYGKEVPLENGEWSGKYIADSSLKIEVDGKPAVLSTENEDVDTDKNGNLTANASASAEVKVADSNGDEIGTIQVEGKNVEEDSISLEVGEDLNLAEAFGEQGQYAEISSPRLGDINEDTFTAKGNGEGLLTIHNEEDEVISMIRLTITDIPDEARIFNQTHPEIHYEGNWQRRENDTYYDGNATFSDEEGDYIEIPFEGTGIRWFGYQTETQGIAEVEVDGEAPEEVDTYAEEPAYQTEIYSVEGLDYGEHTLTIRVTGGQNQNSNGQRINIDSFEVIQ
ncbi:CotH kinase family protein [Alteribacillus sp. HJP-4]|uniref:CotH kinase family protein n=1 Tax=Alteribacillus sp. HJP-4 TaxID=2775394 RepID=UPI0035CD136C